jgi:protein-disulfide isomerase
MSDEDEEARDSSPPASAKSAKKGSRPSAHKNEERAVTVEVAATKTKARTFTAAHLAMTLVAGIALGGGGTFIAAKNGLFNPAKDAAQNRDKPNAYVPAAQWTVREGPEHAKVTIVDFSDFQCPHCSRVAPLLKELVGSYNGAVSVHLRNFPLQMHADAEPAARALQAASRQGKGSEMSEKMFANMKALKAEDLEKYAGELGLDVAKFKADFESQELKDEVAKDLQTGKDAGVRGTPAIFINGLRYNGARTAEGFKAVIDAEIKKADELIKSGTPIEKVYETIGKKNAPGS